PRLMPEPPGDLPPKLRYVTSGVGGKLRYIRAVLKAARSVRSSQPSTPVSQIPASNFSLVLCGHINLLPIAWLAHRLMRRASRTIGHKSAGPQDRGQLSSSLPAASSQLPASLLLVVHGIDAWKPTRSWLANRLVRKTDGFI